MTTISKSPKQTAGNNPALRAVKAWFNPLIFRRASEVMNTAGPEATAEFIGQLFNDECRAERVAAIMAGEMPVR